ncbi:MAG: hypothetical protein WD356_05785 [Pseudomonadales bacterium]
MNNRFHVTTMFRRISTPCGFLLVALLTGCGAPAILSCEAAHGITPDCRFQNPEDLVASPKGNYIVVGQYGDMEGNESGNLVAVANGTGDIHVLFPGDDTAEPNGNWGEKNCPPPPTDRFAPHGIDIEQLNTGRHALYVVNHGGRESVEMFEVTEADAPGGIELTWRGCALAPEDGYFNDLVVLKNGDFRVSQMYPREANVTWAALRMQFTDYAPGYVYHWSPEDGFERLPGTDAQFANGVEKSADERYLFVNSYFGNEVIKVDTVTGERVGSAEVSSPDNLSWSPTGELLAASHHASITEMMACQDLHEGNCGFRFQIVAIDTEDMEPRVLLDHEGPPMGAATVALPYGDAVYLGTFAGDRIARVSDTILTPAGEQ